MPISTPYLESTTSHGDIYQPVLTIIEQPARETRYRYKSESGSHGPLIGESSTPQRKTYPAVKLEHYDPKVSYRVKASLFTHDSNPQPHVHKITMKGRDEDDCCYVTVREDGKAVFPSMSIVFQQKKTVAEMLYRRKLHEFEGTELPEAKKKQLQNDAKKEASEMNLNLVRICFTAECCDKGIWHPVCHVLSNPIANSKAGKLKITKVNRTSGSCTGNDEVWILCEKVNKKDIQIRFFDESWQANATFSESDVHYQVAIVFRTPCYRDTNIQEDVRVKFQLRRISDGDTSDPIDFTYKPRSLSEQEALIHKRRKLSSHSSHSPAMDSGTPGTSTFGSGQGDPYMEQPYDTPTDPQELSEGEAPHSDDDSYMKWCDEFLESAMKNECINPFLPFLPQGSCEEDSVSLETPMRMLSLNNECTARNTLVVCCLLQWQLVCMIRITTAPGLQELLDFLMHFPNKNEQSTLHLLIKYYKHITIPVKKVLTAVSKQLGLRRYVSAKDSNGKTPLHLAASHDNTDMLLWLISSGADIMAEDKNGDTAIHIACKSPKTIKSLIVLINHLDPEQSHCNYFNNDGRTPMHVAIINHNIPAVEELCKCGADVNIAERVNGDTPLHLAVRQHSEKVVAALLRQHSVDIDRVNSEGDSPLQIANSFALNDLVYLLSKGKNHASAEIMEPGDVSSKKSSALEAEEIRGCSAEARASEEDHTHSPASSELRNHVVKMLNSEENARKILGLFESQEKVDKMIRISSGQCLGTVLLDSCLKGMSDDEIRRLLQLSKIA